MKKTIVAIIGGTGLYSFDDLRVIERIGVETPFGSPSSPITRAEIGETEVLFLARHGEGHAILPSEINARANIYALKQLGAEWCISVSAVGSLREDYPPGRTVIPDQLIDRTYGRKGTFFGEGIAAHVSFADPICPVLSQSLHDAAREINPKRVHRGGAYVCMEGPAFSTRAESYLYRSWEASLIGMTALPEAKLAREAEMSYAILATVTDYDCWRASNADVDVMQILEVLKENVEFAREVLLRTIPKLNSATRPSFIANALQHAILTAPAHVTPEVRKRLNPIIGRYISSSEDWK